MDDTRDDRGFTPNRSQHVSASHALKGTELGDRGGSNFWGRRCLTSQRRAGFQADGAHQIVLGRRWPNIPHEVLNGWPRRLVHGTGFACR